MPEYIEREATIATIAKHMASVNAHCYSVNHNKEQYDLYAMATNHAIDYVRCIPAADVAPVVHGRWVLGTTNHHEWMKCSECLHSYDVTGVFVYCPNCGARMDGE